ncbi:MAG: peptidoglycan editing factor PgeF [Thermodesulfobacteriota bacterium]
MPTPFLFAGLFPEQSVFHGVFPRHGGTSAPPYDALNVSFGVGDDPQSVRANRARIKETIGADILVSGCQVHGSAIHVITEKPDNDEEVPDCDAFLTDIAGIGLMVQQADCQAIMLHDPCRMVVANIHNGWRGSVAGIIGETISAMQRYFGCRPADLLAAISPSLGPCCAEFIHYERELPAAFYPFQHRDAHFDFWKISRMQLMASGMRPDSIRCADRCTVCDPSWFSYRREKQTGRFCSIIGLRK